MGRTELASSNQRSKRKSLPLPKAAPWLVIPYGKDRKFQAFYNISEPNNTSCRKFIPELKGKSSFQKNSHQGWLIILCEYVGTDYTPWNYGDCFLLNPLSMETIELPSYPYWRTLHGYCLNDCVLSSPPKSCTSTTDDGDGNSMVFMLFVRKDLKPKPRKEILPGKEILVFCQPGDKEWRTHKFSDKFDIGGSRFMFYLKNKLYIMSYYGEEHLEIDMQYGSEIKILSIRKIKISCNIEYESMGGILSTEDVKYYVESSDEIFMIKKVYIPRGIYEYCVTHMVISKLEFSSMSWLEVTSLDDHVFFISQDTHLCCSAKELGFTHGCVYFTQPDEMSFYMYDLEDKTVMLSLPCPDLPKPWILPKWLMIPTTLCRDDNHTGRETESLSVNNSDDGNNTMAIENSSLAIPQTCTRTNINNDDEEEDIKAGRPWDMLDNDILWLIPSYLTTLDYIHLRAVCRSYRLLFPIENRRRFCSTKSLQTTVLSPWMVFAKDNKSVYSFINPMHDDENYLTSIPELLKGSTIRFSKGGWLLMSKGEYSVFFYNPFTKAIIKLPDLLGPYEFQGICFSSLPNSPDCVVFAIGSGYKNGSLRISFIKREDKFWRYKYHVNKDFELGLNSPIFYKGSFYCLDVNATLGVFTLEENGGRWEVMSMVPPPNCGLIYKSYLVEQEGNLLSVLLGHYGKWVRIFRLDMSEKVWFEVENLGRHVLFVSNTSCIAKIAPTGQMENKIYFPRLQNQGVLFYSLDSRRYHSLGSEHSRTDYCNSNDNLRSSWIEPNWSDTALPNIHSDNSDGDDDVCQDYRSYTPNGTLNKWYEESDFTESDEEESDFTESEEEEIGNTENDEEESEP